MSAVPAITLWQGLCLRGIIIGVHACALATSTAPPPPITLRDDGLSELGTGAAKVPAGVDDSKS